MTPERMQKIRNLFEAALEQDAAERERFVEHASRNDSELRAEVLRMLEAHQRANGYLSRPAADLTGTTQVHAAERVFAAGDVVANRFDIVELLGAGGMGEVYRARDRKLHRDVALKVVLHRIYVSSYQRARFEREARAASALNHPNIATVYDLFEESAVQFIAMELVRGRTLAELIPSGGMPVEQAIEYAAQIADALKAAHAAGIVHRDMKPRNVAITETGTVKVLDFGLAKLVDRALEEEPESVSETASGLILGTAAYMSPEQAEGGPVDHRSDIFSFGAVLYEMLTGRRAFEGSSPASVIAAVLKEEPRFPQELATSIPVELQRLVMRCLRKDIETRSQRMSDIRVALDEVRNGQQDREFARGICANHNSQRQGYVCAGRASGTRRCRAVLVFRPG